MDISSIPPTVRRFLLWLDKAGLVPLDEVPEEFRNNCAAVIPAHLRGVLQPGGPWIDHRIWSYCLGRKLINAGVKGIYDCTGPKPWKLIDEKASICLSTSGQLVVDTIMLTDGTPPADAREERDKFCYEQYVAGVVHKDIRASIRRHDGWPPLKTDKGILQAVRRYAKGHGLSQPPTKTRGRPRKRK